MKPSYYNVNHFLWQALFVLNFVQNHLQKILQVTSGNLGAHLRKLEDEGFISIQKTFLSRKPRTYIETTALGHQAFAEHVAALADILQQTPTTKLDESD